MGFSSPRPLRSHPGPRPAPGGSAFRRGGGGWDRGFLLLVGVLLLGGGVPAAERPDDGSGWEHASGSALVLFPLPATLCGEVRLARDGSPLGSVAVRLLAVDGREEGVPVRWTLSDADGRFCLSNLPEGVLRIGAERIGLVGQVMERVIERREEGGALLAPGPPLRILMAERALELPGVVVTAQDGSREGAGSSGPGSRSTIRRAAIEHLQATSLADLLQLVPGQVAANPSLASANQSLLRQVPTSAEAARANALGTALLLDGAPLSNNANLQQDVTILNSGAGSLPPFSSVAGRGVDLRTLSPDEVEVLEVIRGIPSARHGDLTTGLLSVQTRIGARHPELRLRANPTLLDLGVSAGWGERPDRDGWSVTGTLTRAQDDPRQTLDNFYRGGLQMAWRRGRADPGAMDLSLRIHGWSTLDERRRDPDDLRNQIERASRDQGLRVSTRGHWRPGGGEGGLLLSWTASGTAARQDGRFQSLVGRSITPISTALVDTTQVGIYGPSEYLNVTTVEGRPVNGYARFEAEVEARTGGWRHRPVAGVEWRHDRNRGEGRQFDLLTPPRQNYNVGDRPRSYREVPALNQASAYLEHRVAGSVAGRRLDLHAGLRFDNVAPVSLLEGRFGQELQPRINAALEVREGVRVRIGAGEAAKAPPLAFLYPGPRFFDLVNLNYFAPDPAERLLLLTTRVVEPSNEDARAYVARKIEGGMEVEGRGARGNLTVYRENTRGAYGWDRELVVFPVERFGIVDTPPGRPPVLTPEPIRVDTFYSAYDRPAPTRDVENRGVEFTLDLPEWSRLRTFVSIGGGWTRTRVENRSRAIDAGAFFFSSAPPSRVGVYAHDGTLADRGVTSLRVIHRAPEVGLVVSALVQTIWWDRRRAVGVEAYPRGFVDREGRIHPLSPEEAARPENADLLRTPTDAYLATDAPPPLWLLNLRLSKALAGGLEMAFFVNNALAHRPLWESPRTGGFVQRNPPLFFGMELVSRVGL